MPSQSRTSERANPARLDGPWSAIERVRDADVSGRMCSRVEKAPVRALVAWETKTCLPMPQTAPLGMMLRRNGGQVSLSNVSKLTGYRDGPRRTAAPGHPRRSTTNTSTSGTRFEGALGARGARAVSCRSSNPSENRAGSARTRAAFLPAIGSGAHAPRPGSSSGTVPQTFLARAPLPGDR